MRDWYSHYRFSIDAKQEIYNTDMVLYYVDQVNKQGHIPYELIDQNVKIDYGKLRHLPLQILNQTIQTLLYGYLRDAYEDVDCFQAARVGSMFGNCLS